MAKNKQSPVVNKQLKRKLTLRAGILSVVSLLTIASFLLIKATPLAEAACSPPATTYGTDTMTVSVPAAATYNVWVRMQAPAATSNSIMLQVDGGTCYNVGGNASMPLNTWTWVNYQNASSTQTMQSSLTAGSHSLELIGTQAGVSVDNILLLNDATCVPTGTGTNCTPAITTPPPSAPTNVTAKANSPTSVSLGWSASTDTGGPGLAGYYVLRGGTKIGQVNGTTTSYTDSTATANTTYSYTIEAFDSASPPNVSSPSSAASVTTPKPPKPTAPTNVTATAGSYKSVLLNWSASSDPGGPGLAGYYIIRGGTTIAQVNNPSTTYTDNTALANTTYSYTIEAFDSASPPNVSSPSSAVSVTTPKTPSPSAPTNVSATAVSSTSVSLGWTASNANGGLGVAGYDVYRDGALIGGSTTTSYTDNTATANTTYSYTIDAFDSASPPNVSSPSSAVSVTTPKTPSPSAPTNVSAKANNSTSVSLGWSASTDTGGPGLAGYYVLQGGTKIGQVNGTTTSYADTVVANTTYSYTIEAFDSASPPNVSSPSSAASVTTPKTPQTPPPSAPTNITAKANSPTSVSLGWSASTDTGGPGLAGYYVLRGGTNIGQVNGTTTSYTDSTAAVNTTYSYTIEAFDSASPSNVSSPSSAAGVTTPKIPPPTAPTNVTATAASPTSVSLSWTGSTDTGGPGLAGYYIIRGGTTIAQVNNPSTTYTDNTVNANTTYSYTIEAFDSASPSNVSSPSSAAGVTTPNPPDTVPPTQPTNLMATAISTSQINLSWTASTDNVGVAHYIIYRNGTQLATVTTNSYGDTGLSASTMYSYYVVAADAAGNKSLASTTVSATTQAPATTTGTVEGTVTDAKTNQPIAGAYVYTGIDGTANGMATAYTNSAGQYVLTNLIISYSHSYYFSASGYISAAYSFNIPQGITIYNVSLVQTPVQNPTTSVQNFTWNPSTKTLQWSAYPGANAYQIATVHNPTTTRNTDYTWPPVSGTSYTPPTLSGETVNYGISPWKKNSHGKYSAVPGSTWATEVTVTWGTPPTKNHHHTNHH
jgi:fibronectin type 3 domain-containing protein